MKHFKPKILVGLMALLSTCAVQAVTKTTTSQVTTSITATCTLSATTMAFASFSPGPGTTAVRTSTISPICSKGTAYTIKLNGGLGGGVDKQMTHSTVTTEKLMYEIYSSDMTTKINAGDFLMDASGTGDGFGGADQSFVLNGTLNPDQRVITGAYNDTLTLTVTY